MRGESELGDDVIRDQPLGAEQPDYVALLRLGATAKGTYLDPQQSADLAAIIAALEADSARLDKMEQFALEDCDTIGHRDVVELEQWVETADDDEDVTLREFTVAGPRTQFGSRLGRGSELRDAIDDAMRWEGASNLHDIKANEPAHRGAETRLTSSPNNESRTSNGPESRRVAETRIAGSPTSPNS